VRAILDEQYEDEEFFMTHPKVSTEEMQKRIVRFKDLEGKGLPLMFIDSILPGHRRMNYAVIGDTASENPDFRPILDQPHRFQIGMFMCPPGSGPAYHTHDYIEVFLPLSGTWRYYWGNDPEGPPEGEAILETWDLISLPPGLWRGFENVSDQDAWCFAVLEEHVVFSGKDPYWPASVMKQAQEYGLEVDEHGKMIKPENYEELRNRLEAEVLHRTEPAEH
jgi:quercetin dioxygenase-like cupin family protein